MLRTIERKVLGALLIHTDNDMDVVDVKLKSLAHTMGYKEPGGAITSALHSLEMKNFLIRTKDGYKVLL